MAGNGIQQQGVRARRPNVVMGYVIIPQNADREHYVARCLRTNTVGVLSENNEFLWNVKIDPDLFNRIDFPEVSSGLGTCVVLLNVSKHNKPIVINALGKNDDVEWRGEHELRLERFFRTGFASVVGNAKRGQIDIAVNSSKPNGGRIIVDVKNAFNRGKLEINVQGNVAASSLTFEIQCTQSYRSKVYDPSREDSINEISINVDQGITIADQYSNSIHTEQSGIRITTESLLSIEADQIEVNYNTLRLGSASNAAVLGNALQAQLNLAKARMDLLIQTIQLAPVVAGDGGASFKSTLVSALSGIVGEQYDSILSQKMFLD